MAKTTATFFTNEKNEDFIFYQTNQGLKVRFVLKNLNTKEKKIGTRTNMLKLVDDMKLYQK